MNKLNLKRICITRVHDEIMILYRGKSNIHVKRFKLHFGDFFKKLGYAVAFICLTVALVIAIPFGKNKVESSVPDEDDELKNEILLSDNTDYTDPDEKAPMLIETYTVKDGDTLSAIASKFGVSMDTILGSSSLTSYDVLRVGQTLKVPNKDGIVHTIKDGQKLADIAANYKIPVDKIVAANQLLNPDFLPVGADIFIPDAKPQNIVQGFIWPTATKRITSGFGWRRHPITGIRQLHTGIDIGVSYQWIKAAMYGKVTFAGRMGGYGNAVIIAHPDGKKTLYGHLSSITVKTGQYVKQGQTVAKSGNTGFSTGPHLHFEIIQNGRAINPRKFLK